MAVPEVDKFGQLLVTRLRDGALDFFDGLARGHWKSPSTRRLQADLAKLSREQRDIVRRCVVACVDRGMHDFLFALGEAHELGRGLSVVVGGKDIAELSDGFTGRAIRRRWVGCEVRQTPGGTGVDQDPPQQLSVRSPRPMKVALPGSDTAKTQP